MRLPQSQTTVNQPRLAWNGSQFAVSYRSGAHTAQGDLFVLTFDTQGQSSNDPVQLTQSGTLSYARYTAPLWTQNRYAIAWSDNRNDNFDRVYFQELTATGQPLLDADMRLSSVASYSPTLQINGANYLVGWHEFAQGNPAKLRVVHLRSGSVVNSSNPIAAASQQTAASLHAAHSGSTLTWRDERNGDTSVFFTRINEDGTRTSLGDIALLPSAQIARLLWTGEHYLVVWGDESVRCTTFDADGNRLLAEDIVLSEGNSGSTNPSVALGPNGVAVAWEHSVGDTEQIQFSMLDYDCTPQMETYDITPPDWQAHDPSLAWSTDGFFGLTWIDHRPNEQGIYFRTIVVP